MKITGRTSFPWLLSAMLLTVGLLITDATAGDQTHALSIVVEGPAAKDLLLRCPLSSEQTQRMNAETQWKIVAGETQSPVQIIHQGEQAELVFPLAKALPAGHRRVFELRPDVEECEGPLQIVRDEKTLRVVRGECPVFVYHTRPVLPAGVSEWYQRSGHIHPLYTPAGQIVSDDFAPDHRHQHGLFFAWVNTQVGNRTVDFWNQAKQQGTVRHVETLNATAGPVTAAATMQLAHIAFTDDAEQAAAGEQTVLSETWDLLLHPADDLNLLEIVTVQQNVSDQTVTLNQHHYGGFALRAKRKWLIESDGDFNSPITMRTDAHDNREAGNHTQAQWVSIHGPGDFQQGPTFAGAAILGHPSNPLATQHVRLHPTKPYFCFCPVVEKSITLQPGDELRSRYLVATFDDAVDSDRMNELSAAFGQQPRVELRINGE